MKPGILLAVAGIAFFCCAGVLAGVSPEQRPLSFEARVRYQRAIEEVYQTHRIWPKENPNPKPPLSSVMPDAAIAGKVDDYLRKSNALEVYWQRPITAQQLQEEIDRMVKQTRDPGMLRELFAALDNDPYVIAECLARPLLADRLSHNWYSSDSRFHGGIRNLAQAELAWHGFADMRKMHGDYSEVLFSKKATEGMPAPAKQHGKIELSPAEWSDFIGNLRQIFSVGASLSVQDSLRKDSGHHVLPLQQVSGIQENEDRFFAVAILENGTDHVRLATVSWQKQPFSSWWKESKTQLSPTIQESGQSFILPADPVSSCTDDTWTPTDTATAPSARYEHTAIWTGTEMIVWGGYGPGGMLITGGRYDPSTDTWTATSTVSVPEPRVAYTAVWTGSEMIIWGGYFSFSNYSSDGGRYNPMTDTWVPTSNLNAPNARGAHTAVWTGNEMIIWGGYDDLDDMSSGSRYNPSTDTWTPTSTSNAPSPRSSHIAVWTGSEMIVWGGNSLLTGGRYFPLTDSWVATSTLNAPDARYYGPTAVWTGSEMIIWGGYGTSGLLSSGGRYDPSTDGWTPTSITDAPDARASHTAVWTGAEMIIWGGYDFASDLNTGGRYNPSTDTWASGGTNTTTAPSARDSHTAVWTGNEMIVWGGYGSAPLDTGGSYCVQQPNLSIAVADSMDPVSVGSNLTYTITVQNNTASNANSVTVTNGVADTVSWTGLAVVSATPSQGSCSGTTTITCSLGTLAPSETATIAIVVTPAAANSQHYLRDRAIVFDPDLGTNSASEFTMVLPGLLANDISFAEGNSGNTIRTFTVALYPASTRTVTVDYETADGTAFDGTDYIGVLGTLTFFPGQTSKTIKVKIVGDTTYESNEVFYLELVNPGNAGLADGEGTATILNDDVAPTITITDRTLYENNSGTTSANFTVFLSAAAGVPVTVQYATANGTATAASDYGATSGTLTIPAGNVTGIITVSVIGDLSLEPDETFYVNLSNPTNAILADSQAVGTILNDDGAACLAPDERIYLYSVTLDLNNNPVLNFEDFNQPTQVTGYDIYRASSPAPPNDPAWILVGSDVVDGDQSAPNKQWVDFSGDPGTFYYEVVAFNHVCGGEGPW